ncbi:MAG: PQQ-like beta-propeller repeat protein [Pirellula sp.]|jgi:outer membrane protein assembly factor BamB|nr:PQQ-like beta-propeller repeat protein [Pirellula sp.]
MAYRFVSFCVGIALAACHLPVHAQFETQQLAQHGLTMHWRASIGGVGLRNGDSSLTLWTSQAGKSEVVSVLIKVPQSAIAGGVLRTSLRIKVAGKDGKPASFVKVSEFDRLPTGQEIEVWNVIEQFKASDTDWNKLAGSSDGVASKLGSAGAQAMAESVAKTYRALKREVEIVSETLDSTYLVAINRNGLLTSIDAETGNIYWQNQLPSYDLNTFGPGVSDEYVAVVNGNHLMVYGLEFGNLVSTQQLQYVPTGKVMLWKDRVLVPSAGGRCVSYSAVDATAAPTVVRLGLENRKSLTQSSDSRFFGWITDKRLIIAKHDRLPKLWTSIDAETEVPGIAVAVDDGFLFLSEYGTMIRTNLTSNNAISWRRKFGKPTGSTPVVSKSHAAFVSQNGMLVVADLSNGQNSWERPIGGMSKVLNVTANRLYAMDQAGKFSIVDLTSGRVLAKLPGGGYTPIANNVNDRIMLISEFGELICLREIDSELPVNTTTKVLEGSDAKKPVEAAPEASPGETMSSGASPFEIEKPATEQSLADPFGG